MDISTLENSLILMGMRIYSLFESNLIIFYICTSKNLKTPPLKGFWVHNNYLNLCGQVENSKWTLCCRKTGVNADCRLWIKESF